MKTALCIIGILFSIALIWCCGFLTGRITAPEPPQKVVYIKPQPKPKAKPKSRKERTIYTSKRGKKYYLTPAGNKVYIKPSNPGV